MEFDQQTLDRSDQWGRILAICHFVLGALVSLFSLLPGVYVVMGAAIMFIDLPTKAGEPPPAVMGAVLASIGLVAMAVILTIGIGMIVSGVMILKRKAWVLILIVSCLNMLNQPMGMILGIFTMLWLMREDVRAAFESSKLDYVDDY